MATFGAIPSPFAPANALFDLPRQDLQMQQFQRNRLALESGQQDMQDRTAIRALGPGLAQQDQGALGQLTAINPTMGAQVGAAWGLMGQRRGEQFQRDNAARLQIAQEVFNLPEDQAAAAWPTLVARAQAAGFGLDMPQAYPGRQRIEATVRGGMPMMEQMRMRAMEQLDGQLGGGGAPAAGGDLPRGLRNNNPLNIEAGNFTQGRPGFQGSDGRFARFETLEQGMEAADALLQSYAQRGLNTPAAIIGRWAPASDGNNVSAYAQAVARRLGVRPDQPIDMQDPGVRRRLAEAMAEHENGRPLPSPGQGMTTPATMTTSTQAAGGGGLTDGLTPEQVQTLRTMRASPGADPGSIARQAQTYREQNRQAQRQADQDRRAEEAAARRNAPGGPISGDGLTPNLMNILLTGDPASAEYAAAFAELGAEQVRPDGTILRRDMRPYRTPTFQPPSLADASAAPGQTGGRGPAHSGGRDYGTPETSRGTSTQAREAIRKAETDLGRLEGALDRYIALVQENGGIGFRAYINDPTSPAAQRINGAAAAVELALRGEGLLNTGVLQPGEIPRLMDTYLAPNSLRGLMSDPAALAARLNELRAYARNGLTAARRSAGMAPDEGPSTTGPGGQGTASPPPGLPPPPPGFRLQAR